MLKKIISTGHHGLWLALFSLSVMLMSIAPALAGDTQIVVQWPAASALDAAKLQDTLQQGSDDLYFVEGSESANGALNVYLFADDASVEASVKKIIALADKGALPPGMRIGVAVYRDAERTGWSYRPAYPAALKAFSITN